MTNTQVPELVESDRALTGNQITPRAAQLFDQWRTSVQTLALANAADPLGDKHSTFTAEYDEDARREYLIEFVELHGLNYSQYDPRNDYPGIADTQWAVNA